MLARCWTLLAACVAVSELALCWPGGIPGAAWASGAGCWPGACLVRSCPRSCSAWPGRLQYLQHGEGCPSQPQRSGARCCPRGSGCGGAGWCCLVCPCRSADSLPGCAAAVRDSRRVSSAAASAPAEVPPDTSRRSPAHVTQQPREIIQKTTLISSPALGCVTQVWHQCSG